MHIINRWNITLVIFSVIFVGYSSGYLSDANAQTVTDFELPDNVGITPDNPFYFVDTIIDQIRINIASSDTERAKIGLEIAEERLVEFKAMVNQNKVDSAETAEEEHNNMMKVVAANLATDESTDEASTEAELESTIEIQERLEVHKKDIEEVKTKVKERLSLNLQKLSENDSANLDKALSGLSTAITRVDIKIDEETTRIKLKFAEDFQKPSTEINQRILNLEEQFGEKFRVELSNSGKGSFSSGSSNSGSGSSNSGSGSSNSGSGSSNSGSGSSNSGSG